MAGSGPVPMAATSACININYHLGIDILLFLHPTPVPIENRYTNQYPCPSFILKTKEQRAAEKALMDKSPLKTLTLEDFLESERHKLTGNLTPVTPETFAKWKKERMDKKAAEAEALKAKEATGRAMFEKGDWEVSEDEEDEGSDGEEEGDGAWNLEAMRKETERIRAEKEAQRVGAGKAVETNGHMDTIGEGDDDGGTDCVEYDDDDPQEESSGSAGR